MSVNYLSLKFISKNSNDDDYINFFSLFISFISSNTGNTRKAFAKWKMIKHLSTEIETDILMESFKLNVVINELVSWVFWNKLTEGFIITEWSVK